LAAGKLRLCDEAAAACRGCVKQPEFVGGIGCRSGAKSAFATLTKGKADDWTAGNSPGYIG